MTNAELDQAEYLKVQEYFEAQYQRARAENPELVPYYVAQIRKLLKVSPLAQEIEK